MVNCLPAKIAHDLDGVQSHDNVVYDYNTRVDRPKIANDVMVANLTMVNDKKKPISTY
jgi:hypothetical protein